MDPRFIKEIMKPVYSEHAQLNETILATTQFSGREYQQNQKEFNRLQKIIDLDNQYNKLTEELASANEGLKKETDAELIEMFELEIEELTTTINKLEEHISISLLPPDPDDDNNVFIEIRSGAGGDEASIFIGDLYRMYTLYAQTTHFKLEVLDSAEGTSGGYKDITFLVKGERAYATFKYESGVHRVQRVPKTETQGRVHTSTVTVAVMPEQEEADFEINPDDLKIETTRAQGAGGQHVNKTESAVRILHIPTGIIVQCQEERSQFKNKEKAMRALRAKVKERQMEETKQVQDDLRRSQIGSGDRAEKIRTYNFPQNRLTDHRIGLTLYNLDRIMNGDLHEIFNQLMTADKKKALEIYLKRAL